MSSSSESSAELSIVDVLLFDLALPTFDLVYGTIGIVNVTKQFVINAIGFLPVRFSFDSRNRSNLNKRELVSNSVGAVKISLLNTDHIQPHHNFDSDAGIGIFFRFFF